jgi:hypothetical protein
MSSCFDLEEGDDPDRSEPFDFNLACRPELIPLAAELDSRLIGSEGFRKARPSSLDKAQEATQLILQNLVNAVECSNYCFLAVPRDRNIFNKSSRYRPISVSYDWFIKVLDFLSEHDPPLILVKGAFKDHESGIGRRTRIKASGWLRSVLRRFSAINTNQVTDISVIFDNLNRQSVENRLHLPASWRQTPSNPELIRLKNAKGELIDYDENDDTKGMRSRLQTWNEFSNDNFHVGLLLPDDKIESLYTDANDFETEAQSFYSDVRDRPRFVRFDQTQLYRVFNNSSFEQGGRFYGGWWQQIPSKLRRYITINEGPTREFDFSNLHAAMLYAKEGLKLENDAYVLPGLDAYRKLVKTTFFKMMNAYEDQRIDPPRKDALPPGLSWADLQRMILEKHAPIAHRLKSGDGIRMQRLDADIAEDVMLAMMKRNYLALPIHDSFITYSGIIPIIVDEMKSAYRARMNQEVGVDADLSFLEQEGIWPTHDEGQNDPEDIVRDRVQSSGYEGYDARLRAFLRTKSDDWRWRFGPGHTSGPL